MKLRLKGLLNFKFQNIILLFFSFFVTICLDAQEEEVKSGNRLQKIIFGKNNQLEIGMFNTNSHLNGKKYSFGDLSELYHFTFTRKDYSNIFKLTKGVFSRFFGLRYYNGRFPYPGAMQYTRKFAHKLFFNFGYQGYGANYYNLGNSDVPVNFKIGDVTEIYGNQKWVGLKYQIFEKENLAFFLGLDFRKRNEVIYQLIGKFL